MLANATKKPSHGLNCRSATDGQLIYTMVGKLATSVYSNPGGDAAMSSALEMAVSSGSTIERAVSSIESENGKPLALAKPALIAQGALLSVHEHYKNTHHRSQTPCVRPLA